MHSRHTVQGHRPRCLKGSLVRLWAQPWALASAPIDRRRGRLGATRGVGGPRDSGGLAPPRLRGPRVEASKGLAAAWSLGWTGGQLVIKAAGLEGAAWVGHVRPSRIMPGGVAPALGPGRRLFLAGEEQSVTWPGRWGS